jgi:hypothetical protein
MTEHPYQQIDSLFAQLRLRLLEIRQSDPQAVEELKSLVSQLEDCVEQLLIDYLRLRSLESKTQKATRSIKRTPKRAARNSGL